MNRKKLPDQSKKEKRRKENINKHYLRWLVLFLWMQKEQPTKVVWIFVLFIAIITSFIFRYKLSCQYTCAPFPFKTDMEYMAFCVNTGILLCCKWKGFNWKSFYLFLEKNMEFIWTNKFGSYFWFAGK